MARIPARTAVVLATIAGSMALSAPAAGTPSEELGLIDQELTAMFTPAAAPAAAYEVYRSPEPIARLAARLRAQDPSPLADAWRVQRLDAIPAFGAEGRYDHGRLARLYDGRRPLVARGALRDDEGVVGYTLITPHPDPTLSVLVSDTMVIVVRTARLLRLTKR